MARAAPLEPAAWAARAPHGNAIRISHENVMAMTASEAMRWYPAAPRATA